MRRNQNPLAGKRVYANGDTDDRWGLNGVITTSLNLGIPADGVTASAGVLRHFVKRAGDVPVQLAIGCASAQYAGDRRRDMKRSVSNGFAENC